ncbi:MAG TPA: hypothetical protein VFF39_19070 [Verrucomicrobiae bacterium]|jgi:hypothetical protein|nr:hypothetical protein [Verrucomicrobiae bacterium]
MDDDQKWLAAAAGIEQDIRYLKKAMRAGTNATLEQDIHYLRTVLAVYKKNAANGVAWPNPDDLYCINILPFAPRQISTAMRRDFKTAI